MSQRSARDRRIEMEIIVDCYTEEEQAMGWYYYLEENLHVPFRASCIERRAVSPLKEGDEVEVMGMAPESECEHEMFVMIRWGIAGLAVPLIQLKPGKGADASTRRAIEDWHY
jgi:hypothetical protein